MLVRKVTKNDDFESIGNIYASSWKTAYHGIVPQDYLDNLSGNRWTKVLKNSEYDAFVVMDGKKYAGTSSVSPARDASMKGWGEIISIYLLPEYWGRRYAQPLFQTSVNALRAMGFGSVFLWVLRENIRARKFYEKCGFEKNGDISSIVIAEKELTEIKYVKHVE